MHTYCSSYNYSCEVFNCLLSESIKDANFYECPFHKLKCVLLLAFMRTPDMITVLFFSLSWQTVYFGNVNILSPLSPINCYYYGQTVCRKIYFLLRLICCCDKIFFDIHV